MKEYSGFWLQLGRFSGSSINNHIVKLVFLFLLYLSYTLVLISVVLTLLNGEDEKDEILNYINNQGQLVLLIVLIVLGAGIYILYKTFAENKEYTAKTRKKLNLIIDLLRGIFHVVYAFYVYPFIQEHSDL